MIVRELITRLGFQLNNAQVQNAERATNRLKQQADQAAQSFRNIVVGLASVAGVRAIANIADSMQSLESRVGMLPQTIDDVGSSFEEMGKHARETRTPLEAYGTLYVRLGNAGKDYIKTQKELLGITDTVANSLVVGGASAAEAGSVMLQFSQAIGSGVMQGGEFNAMAEASPQFMDQLAVAMNYPREQLKKLASEGKLTSKEVIEGVKKMQDYFERRAKQMPMTIGQATEDVKTRFSIMIARMNRESGLVTKVAEKIISAFDKIESGVDSIVKSFDGWNNVLRYVGAALAVAIGAKAIAIVAAFGAATWAAMGIWALIGAAILVVAAIVEDLYAFFTGSADSLTASLIGPFSEWSVYVKAALMMVYDIFATVFDLVAELFLAFVGLMTGDLKLFTKSWSDAAQIIYDVMVGAFDNIKRSIKEVLNMLGIDINSKWSIGASGPQQYPSVSPYSMVRAPTVPEMNYNNTVNIQVPQGTGTEQVAFVKSNIQKYMNSFDRPVTTSDMMPYQGNNP